MSNNDFPSMITFIPNLKAKNVDYTCKDCEKHVQCLLMEAYYFLEENKICAVCHVVKHNAENHSDI